MRVILNREPRDYKVSDAIFSIVPASKDDLAKYMRATLYQMEHGDSYQTDPHLFEKMMLLGQIKGWQNLLDEDDHEIKYTASGAEAVIGCMDQFDRDVLCGIISSPSRNRSRLVVQEKNGSGSGS